MVELVIAMGIGVVVAVLAVTVMRTAIQTQGAVTASTVASTRGQIIGTLLGTTVRQAAGAPGFKISSRDGSIDNRLDVRLPGSPGACASFEVSDADHQLYYRKVTGAATGDLSSSWMKLLAWGQASASASLSVTHAQDASGADLPYFAPVASATGFGVAYGFRLTEADTRVDATVHKIDLISRVAQRATGGVGPSCFS